jgi:hypothetical protein
MTNEAILNIHNHIKLSQFIANANNPQIGSFGESIFCEACRKHNMTVKPVHFGQCDFEIGEQKVDVKTSRRKLGRKLLSAAKFVGHRISGVAYAMVEFHEDGALISLENKVLGELCWKELEAIYSQWINGTHGKKHSPKNAIQSKLPENIIAEIKKIFTQYKLPYPYLLYRTVMFDGESPQNLLPSQRQPKRRVGWTVFLIFKKAPPTITSLDRIIAFPDQTDTLLPRLKKIRTSNHIKNLEKVDLSLLPQDYVMRNLGELSDKIFQQIKSKSKGSDSINYVS